MMLRLAASFLLAATATASFCGESAVPYSVEILRSGHPVLGCAKPTCFGRTPYGQPTPNTGTFFSINGAADGFLRQDPPLPAFSANDYRYFRPQSAICDHSYTSPSCQANDQWVGGIAPLVNVSRFTMMLQCCAYAPLLQSEDRGVATLAPGNVVIGGEVYENGKQFAFDYISDMSKTVDENGQHIYHVAVRRFHCPGVEGEKLAKPTGAQAFQEPNVEVAAPIDLNAAQPQLLEEVVREEALQFPPGTQFQPAAQAGFQQAAGAQLVPPPFGAEQAAAQAAAAQAAAAQAAAAQASAAAAAPAAASAASAAGYAAGGAGGGGACFTADTLVTMGDGSRKRMDQLEIDDWVATISEGQVEIARLRFWLHRIPDQVQQFLKLTLETGEDLKLTEQHFIYKTSCDGPTVVRFDDIVDTSVPAEDVNVGDCLYTLPNAYTNVTKSRVVHKTTLTQIGIYAPMTDTGNLLVNDIHASCQTNMPNHQIGSTFLSIHQFLKNALPSVFGENGDVTQIGVGVQTFLDVASLVLPASIQMLPL